MQIGQWKVALRVVADSTAQQPQIAQPIAGFHLAISPQRACDALFIVEQS
jgi:hypothetical protein